MKKVSKVSNAKERKNEVTERMDYIFTKQSERH